MDVKDSHKDSHLSSDINNCIYVNSNLNVTDPSNNILSVSHNRERDYQASSMLNARAEALEPSFVTTLSCDTANNEVTNANLCNPLLDVLSSSEISLNSNDNISVVTQEYLNDKKNLAVDGRQHDHDNRSENKNILRTSQGDFLKGHKKKFFIIFFILSR